MTRMTVVIGSTSAKHRIMAPPLEAEIAVELFGAMARRCSSMDVLNSLLGANRWIFENLPPRLKERALELIILAHDKIADDNCESDDVHHRSDDAERRWLRAVEDARDDPQARPGSRPRRYGRAAEGRGRLGHEQRDDRPQGLRRAGQGGGAMTWHERTRHEQHKFNLESIYGYENQ